MPQFSKILMGGILRLQRFDNDILPVCQAARPIDSDQRRMMDSLTDFVSRDCGRHRLDSLFAPVSGCERLAHTPNRRLKEEA